MAANNNNSTSNITLRTVLEKDKLNGTNFLDWFRNLRIVLKQERKLYVLDAATPPPPAANAPRAERDAHTKHVNDVIDVGCLMLATMTSAIQKQLEDMEPDGDYAQGNVQEQARLERYATSKALFSCKMVAGSSVSTHVLKMKSHIVRLEKLGSPLSQQLATDVILQSLPSSFDQFVLNFNMNNMERIIPELHGMLKNAEQNLKGTTADVLMVQKGKGKGRGKQNNAKGKGKLKAKGKDFKPKAKGKAPKEGICFFYEQPGH